MRGSRDGVHIMGKRTTGSRSAAARGTTDRATYELSLLARPATLLGPVELCSRCAVALVALQQSATMLVPVVVRITSTSAKPGRKRSAAKSRRARSGSE